MNIRLYPALHLDTNYSKETVLLLLFYISQSLYKVFNKEQMLICQFSVQTRCNKYIEINITCFWNNLHQVRSRSFKVEKPNNLKSFGIK